MEADRRDLLGDAVVHGASQVPTLVHPGLLAQVGVGHRDGETSRIALGGLGDLQDLGSGRRRSGRPVGHKHPDLLTADIAQRDRDDRTVVLHIAARHPQGPGPLPRVVVILARLGPRNSSCSAQSDGDGHRHRGACEDDSPQARLARQVVEDPFGHDRVVETAIHARRQLREAAEHDGGLVSDRVAEAPAGSDAVLPRGQRAEAHR